MMRDACFISFKLNKKDGYCTGNVRNLLVQQCEIYVSQVDVPYPVRS
jgi:hypothetical protein